MSVATVVDVTNYGAVDDGVTNNDAAIAAAYAAAVTRGAYTVLYFPKVTAGVYGMTQRINHLSGPPLVFEGPGRGIATIRQLGTGQVLRIQVDGSVLCGLTLDTQTNGGNTVCSIQANNTVTENVGILAGSFFGIRWINPVSLTDRKLASQALMVGNQADDVVVNAQGTAGNVGFDVDFQYGFLGRRFQLTGSSMTVYICQNARFEGFHYNGTQTGWTITSQSDSIYMSDVQMTGGGGTLQAAAGIPGRRNTGILIEGMVVTDGSKTVLGDAYGVTFSGSRLGLVSFAPDEYLGGVAFVNGTTVQSTQDKRAAGAVVCGVVGLPANLMPAGGAAVCPNVPPPPPQYGVPTGQRNVPLPGF